MKLENERSMAIISWNEIVSYGYLFLSWHSNSIMKLIGNNNVIFLKLHRRNIGWQQMQTIKHVSYHFLENYCKSVVVFCTYENFRRNKGVFLSKLWIDLFDESEKETIFEAMHVCKQDLINRIIIYFILHLHFIFVSLPSIGQYNKECRILNEMKLLIVHVIWWYNKNKNIMSSTLFIPSK